MKLVYISWVKYHRRTDLLAKHLGAPMYNVVWGQQGKIWQAPLRYLVQGWRSWQIFRRDKPDVIFIENPPVFNGFVAYLYAILHGKRIVMDSHTGAFISEKWGMFQWLNRYLSKRAITTIITNDYLKRIVDGWQANSFILGYVPGEYPPGDEYPVDKSKFSVAYISSFADDEPYREVMEVARQLPEVNFYVTGNAKKVPPEHLANKPDNFILTGYIPYEQYVGLMRRVDAMLCLTTRDHTLLMGGFEAISLGVPLITSDFPLLKEYFFDGTVYTDNTAAGMAAGIQEAQAKINDLRHGMLRLQQYRDNEWNEKLKALRAILQTS